MARRWVSCPHPACFSPPRPCAPRASGCAPWCTSCHCAPGSPATPGRPIDYEIRDLTVTVGGDVALCHSLNQLGALWFRSTIGPRKTGGAWRITHEHNSTPFYMDGSDTAALDLQP